jgi:membrane protein
VRRWRIYTVFSLAPLILVLLAIVGVIFRDDPAGAWSKLTEQMSYFLDKSALEVVQNIAKKASQPGKSTLATIIGIALALFGASGVFGQLQDALNTVWGVKAKPGLGIWGFLRTRFLSFAMVGGICFLLLVSLAVEALLKGFSHYIQQAMPGGLTIVVGVYLIFDFAVVTTLFAMIFKILPDVRTRWRDMWVGAAMTAVFFLIGKWALGLYLGSGTAASAYGAASSLITLLLWIYYSSQILLFGAEFTQVYAN